ncbi:hypothetical protein BH11PLA2_BH11PLA2_19710 [soil metagenome]
MNKICLLIETSGRSGTVALARNHSIVGEVRLDEARRHARDLASTVQRLLTQESLSPRDVTAVAVGIGPGSYTGLRVGIASAKAFAYATGCELFAVPTSVAIAERVPFEFESFDVIADGLQGLVYHQRFGRGESVNELKISTVAEWVNTSPVAVSGPGVAVHDAMIPADVMLVEVSLRTPTAESMLKALLKLKPVTREELFRIEPLYLRGSSAEVTRDAKLAKS